MEDPDKEPMKRSKADITRSMECDTLIEFDIRSAVAILLDSYVMQKFLMENIPDFYRKVGREATDTM